MNTHVSNVQNNSPTFKPILRDLNLARFCSGSQNGVSCLGLMANL